MKEKYQILAVFIFALIFSFLFYHESAGLNLVIFELLIFIYLFLFEKVKLDSKYMMLNFFTTLVSVISFVINFTALAFLFNLMSFFTFTGVLIYPQARSLVTSANLALINVPNASQNFFEAVLSGKNESRGLRYRMLSSNLRMSVVPVLLIILFLIFYNVSTPYFKNFFETVFRQIGRLFDNVNFDLVMIFLSGLFISLFVVFRKAERPVIKSDSDSNLVVLRRRIKNKFSGMLALKREYLSSVFLLLVLNLLILSVNVLDIWNVWLNFSWNGSYLMQFVHEGTFILILSILTSIAIVLYNFKGNLNFYHRSRTIKTLAIAWMIQNAFLALSVGMRNFWYIHYFALAYKRIGVFLFLTLTLYGIYTVIVKIRETKSTFYLLRNNAAALLIVMFSFSLFNWDNIIAKYNFSHYQKSFIHYDFLASMPDKALPFLLKTKNELSVIDSAQSRLFHLEPIYMTSEKYFNVIQNRKAKFQTRWEQKSLLSWNFAEYNSYRVLKELDVY